MVEEVIHAGGEPEPENLASITKLAEEIYPSTPEARPLYIKDRMHQLGLSQEALTQEERDKLNGYPMQP